MKEYRVTVHENGEVAISVLKGLWQPAVVVPPGTTYGYTLAVILEEVTEG